MSVRFGHASLSDRSRPGRPSRGGLGGVAHVLGRRSTAPRLSPRTARSRSTARSAGSARSSSRRSAPAPAHRRGCTSTSRPMTCPPRWPASSRSVRASWRSARVTRSCATRPGWSSASCPSRPATTSSARRSPGMEPSRVRPAHRGLARRRGRATPPTCPPGWVVGGGLNGGYLLAVMGRRCAPPFPPSRTRSPSARTTSRLPRPARPRSRVDVRREGGSVATAAVELVQDGTTRIAALATVRRPGPLRRAGAPTCAPPPPSPSCRRPTTASGPATHPPSVRAFVPMLDRFDLRLDPAHAAWGAASRA